MQNKDCNILTEHLLDYILSEYLSINKTKLLYPNVLVEDVSEYLNSIFKIVEDVYIEDFKKPSLVIEYKTMGGNITFLKKEVSHILNSVEF